MNLGLGSYMNMMDLIKVGRYNERVKAESRSLLISIKELTPEIPVLVCGCVVPVVYAGLIHYKGCFTVLCSSIHRTRPPLN
jgi:hypothetical protein